MRKDMAKVLVERPRLIDSAARRGRIVPDELLPKSIGLRRGVREAGGFKQLNENLKPLRRYLERQVGRPWNKVFSEIAANLKSSSTVQQHVRDHIRDFVELHPMADALLWPGIGRRRRRGLYVDPHDGLLKRADRGVGAKARVNRPVVAPAPVDTVSLTEDRELRRLQGLWFEVRLAPLPRPEYRAVTRPARGAGSTAGAREITVRQLVTPAVRDFVSGLAVCGVPEIDEPRGWAQYRRARPSRAYAISKRQLSRVELRRHGLSNTAG